MRRSLGGYLADTNLLLSFVNSARVDNGDAVRAVQSLLSRDIGLYYTGQNVAEYWRVATASTTARNGFGWSVNRADATWQQLEPALIYLPETQHVFDEWYQLVQIHSVTGVRVYDARLAAYVLAYGLTGIVTFNAADFTGYGIGVIEPSAL